MESMQIWRILWKKNIKTQTILADWICWSKRYFPIQKGEVPGSGFQGFSRFFSQTNEGLGPGYPQPSMGRTLGYGEASPYMNGLVAFLMVNASRSNLTNMIFQLGWNHQPDLVVEVFF